MLALSMREVYGAGLQAGPRSVKEIPLGVTGQASVTVTENTLASASGSGAVPVFSTPNLVLLMEQAASNAVAPYLDPGEASVGSMVNIRHLAPTPPGLVVTAVARLCQIDGRRLVFQVEATDGVEKVGEGVHERYVVNRERFLTKASQKSVNRG